MTSQTPETFYKSLFENMTDGLAYCQMIFDAQKNPVDWMYIRVNKNFEKLTGLKNAEGKKVSKLIPGIGASNPELFEIYGRVSLTGKPEEFETYVAPLSRWFLISVFSSQKNFFVALFQNITDRKQIEKNLEDAKIAAQNIYEDLRIEKEALANAKVKDEALLASIGDGIIATDPDRKIILMNKVAEKLLGWKINEAIGRFYDDIVLLEDEKGTFVPPKEKPLHKALESRTTTTTTTTTMYLLSKNKIKFPVAITVSPIVLDNKIIGAVEVFRDITKEQEIDKAKTEFISLASHQLRTPLTAVSWYTEMILKGDVGQVVTGQKKYLEEIYQGNNRMIDLVNTLLNISRLELGTFKVEPKPTDVIALAQSVLDEQKQKIEEKKLIIVENFSKDAPPFLTDPKLLRMVFQNLLANSVEYTPSGGKIGLTVSCDKKMIRIEVSDTGYGIPKNQQDKIFTKFFRADNVRDKDTNGTGLGLYIVKSIVENSGGKIWFSSPGRSVLGGESFENPGATFYVTLPLDGMGKSAGGGSASGGKERAKALG